MYISKIKFNPLLYSNDIKNEYQKIMGKTCQLDNPQSFTEKLQWLKLHDIIPEKSRCSDKILLRNYCEETLGKNLCPTIYQIYNSPDLVITDNLPKNSIIKCNHGSGMNIKCINGILTDEQFKQLKYWYKTDFSNSFNNFEFHYRNINRKIFVEKLLDIKYEYKFYCFNNSAKMCECIFFDNMEKSLYKNCATYEKIWSRHDAIVDKKFRLIPNWQFDNPHENYKEINYLKKYYKCCYTDHYNELLKYSEELSKPFKFVRCDFYITNDNKTYLSELTFIPNAGYIKFKNKYTDLMIGKLLNVYN